MSNVLALKNSDRLVDIAWARPPFFLCTPPGLHFLFTFHFNYVHSEKYPLVLYIYIPVYWRSPFKMYEFSAILPQKIDYRCNMAAIFMYQVTPVDRVFSGYF